MRQHFHAARHGSQSAYKAKSATPGGSTEHQRFGRLTDETSNATLKAKPFPGWIIHGSGSRRPMEQPPALSQRHFPDASACCPMNNLSAFPWSAAVSVGGFFLVYLAAFEPITSGSPLVLLVELRCECVAAALPTPLRSALQLRCDQNCRVRWKKFLIPDRSRASRSISSAVALAFAHLTEPFQPAFDSLMRRFAARSLAADGPGCGFFPARLATFLRITWRRFQRRRLDRQRFFLWNTDRATSDRGNDQPDDVLNGGVWIAVVSSRRSAWRRFIEQSCERALIPGWTTHGAGARQPTEQPPARDRRGVGSFIEQ